VADDRKELAPGALAAAVEYDVQALYTSIRDRKYAAVEIDTRRELMELCKCVEYLAAVIIELEARTR
jgi:hypothetical protein